MSEIFSRNELIWGSETQNLLAQKHVIIFGLGGVGGFAAEALTRAGVGELTIIDFDKVTLSNINRQIIALHSTVGKNKAKLFEERLKDINPNITINIFDTFYTKELTSEVFAKNADFVVDAIDTLKQKIDLLEYCHLNNIPIITSMGAGNRMDPTQLKIVDISEIKKIRCSFVKSIIRILDKKNIKTGIVAVISEETPHSLSNIKNQEKITTSIGKTVELTKISPGSVPFTPSVAGYYMAFYVTKKLIVSI